MPELAEQMYCSEQICIPPTFPYLLRQYAKAAIRSQPSDILRWSSAYFRCLSLNLQPPVKVRLEYPIPREFYGITPGWLKTLLTQFLKAQTVSFKVLWDRWMGACLQHNNLIQILCLGAFDQPEAIPWLRFIALCAGHLTDDLTHTMILICEILTEEPEGGSAMITLEVFIDLYKFLAKIDASSDQWLRNYWFRDSLLDLWKERAAKLDEVVEKKEELVETEPSKASKASSEIIEVEAKKADSKEEISCPSLPEDDQYNLEYILQEKAEDLLEEEDEGETEDLQIMEKELQQENLNEKEEEQPVTQKTSKVIDNNFDEEEVGSAKEELEGNSDANAIEKAESTKPETEEEVEEGKPKIEAEDKLELQPYESVETVTDLPVRDLSKINDDDEEARLKEDLERLKALQLEMAGETDDEIEKFKCRLIAEMPLTRSQEDAVDQFREPADESSEEEKIDLLHGIKENVIKDGDASSDSQEEKPKDYEEIFCQAVPGIGGIIPDELIDAVVHYMQNVAKVQHGMVMPRNIRHYSCPPLELAKFD